MIWKLQQIAICNPQMQMDKLKCNHVKFYTDEDFF